MIDLAQRIQAAQPAKTQLFSLGQAGYIVRSSRGWLFGIDLYLSDCVERMEGHIGFKRLLPKLLDPSDLTLDALAATHPHLDHFDMDAIPLLMANGKTHLWASQDCRQEIERLHMSPERVMYISPGDRNVCGDFQCEWIPCDHGEAAPDAVGLILTVEGKRLCFTGDTRLRLDRVPNLAAQGPFDVLIAPINGAFGNMDEEDCAHLSRALQPRLTIPSHYGMFAAHGGNPGLFLERMKELCPQNGVFLLSPGEGIIL